MPTHDPDCCASVEGLPERIAHRVVAVPRTAVTRASLARSAFWGPVAGVGVGVAAYPVEPLVEVGRLVSPRDRVDHASGTSSDIIGSMRSGDALDLGLKCAPQHGQAAQVRAGEKPRRKPRRIHAPGARRGAKALRSGGARGGHRDLQTRW